MSVSAKQVAVSTVAAPLTDADDARHTGESVVRLNNAGAADVFLGGAGVLTTTGYKLAAGATLELRLLRGDEVFAICATTSTVHVLQTT